MMSAEEIIERFKLEPHPKEGGYYRETYRCGEGIPKEALPERYGRGKPFSTAIYYLLTPDTCSALHRLPTDEIFHFYLGDPVMMLKLHQDGTSEVIVMGQGIDEGQHVQVIVPRGTWQGSILKEGGRFALLGTIVAPGFDLVDYEPGDRASLTGEHPDQENLISRLTPPFA